MTVTRRAFVTGAVGALGAAVTGTVVGTTATASPRGTAGPRRVALTREDHRVLIIGSGFGGGVASLRFAEAGVPVTVLERGRRWPSGPNSTTFPSATAPDERLLWYGSGTNLFGRPLDLGRYAGLVEAVPGENMTVLCPAGVGGGSLVYQGMTLQPAKDVFLTQFPEELDWDLMNRVHYPRVARMLGLEVAPDALIESPTYAAPRAFAANARRAGQPVSKIPMPIDWQFALDELAGKMRPSYTNGDGAMGVNNGGKHSVDVTYLAAAEATGFVDVRSLHHVTDVERATDGRWTVYVERIDERGTVLENLILTAGTLVMAAGTMNTTRLLMRAAAAGRIPDLPDALGRGWGSNADRIYAWSTAEHDFGPVQGGPVVYGSLDWSNPRTASTVIQASMPQLGINEHTTVLVGYGVSDARGHFVYDAAKDDAILRWPYEGDAAIQTSTIGPRVQAIAGPGSVLIDTNAAFPSTWHPLGGASMNAVCDLDGRVLGQRGLYVLDGALIPGNCAACNPSMTIAAVAERAMDSIIARDVGTVV
ncbi:GMC oxidoreductase [Rhodococcoides corynebacterioides]|uniref:GMC oxidoreductase n=1 Tax=Rhodococcoides corynebacterioides TaxID=53972 RepID=UPI001C9B31EC|nr:GMC oxidoreductase [Rhodococcus corynebacterioides]MBY6363597.1 GMC family oxidoreductase [Rhodococcus corynebacterioides]